MQHFPKLLSSQIAFDIARVILDGFDKHYRLFRQSSQAARRHFEQMTWKQAQSEARERIAFYDERVRECVQLLEDDYDEAELTNTVWREVKLHYIGMLTDHRQPELAETFFNSVCCKMLHRAYYNNDFIFVRPAVSTEYIEPAEGVPIYRVYYPARDGMRNAVRRMVTNFQLSCEFSDLERDLAQVESRLHDMLGSAPVEPNHQIQVLSSLFYRNKGAYIVGKVVNGNRDHPFVIPVLHNRKGALILDTVLSDTGLITTLFSFTRAYFMVDMEVPSAYVQFLRSMMPNKPKSELYTMLGLQKQGKTLFYRDFLHHLKHSTDRFCLAAGIEGLVMLVFTLPSFPYVFKIIKDKRSKDVSREFIASKYQLVKLHDRAGRMADTWEYSNVDFPAERFESSLIEKIRAFAPNMLEMVDGRVVIKHVYIERRMIPLNLYLEHATEQEVDHAVKEYGDAIRQLVAANIFPGDMLYKNFGMTRHRRVVFYDYDEIQYLTECNFRRIPPPRTPEDEMASEPWYNVGPNDVFPEEFEQFLLGQARLRKPFMKYHAELLQADYWSAQQQRIRNGILDDVFPYPEELRFRNRHELQS